MKKKEKKAAAVIFRIIGRKMGLEGEAKEISLER